MKEMDDERCGVPMIDGLMPAHPSNTQKIAETLGLWKKPIINDSTGPVPDFVVLTSELKRLLESSSFAKVSQALAQAIHGPLMPA